MSVETLPGRLLGVRKRPRPIPLLVRWCESCSHNDCMNDNHDKSNDKMIIMI